MFKPVPMAKVAVVGPKTQLAATIDLLHDLAVLHIEDFTSDESGFELGHPLPQGATVSEHLLRVRGLLKGAQIPPPAAPRPFTPENLRELRETLAEVEGELSHLVEKRNGLLDDAKKHEEERFLLERIQNFPLPLELLRGYRSLVVANGFLPPHADPEALRKVHPHMEWKTSTEAEGTFLVAMAPLVASRALQDAFSELGVQALELPPGPGTAAARMAALTDERNHVEQAVVEVEAKIAAIREKYAPAFYALDEYLSIEADKTSAPVRFRTTRNSFMIEGWIPRNELPRLKSTMADRTAQRVFVTELPTPLTTPWRASTTPPAHEAHPEEAGHAPTEAPPVALSHGALTSPYELLTDTYSRPKYTEIDPTLLFTFGFPFFYGFMLGDIGYALVLLVLIWTGVFRRVFDFFGFKMHWHLNKVLTHSAYLSLLFGFLYSEFFGLELWGEHGVVSSYETHLGPFPFPLARFENVQLLLLVTLAIAALHMMLGLFLGLRNAAHVHGWGDALKHRGSWILILFAAALAGAVGLPSVLLGPRASLADPTPFYVVALACLLGGTILLVIGEGATALLELPTVLSNLLSYTRLVAIGLSSAGIALAGNNVSQLGFSAGGVGGWATGVLILLFFHALNLALGVIGPALHSLRLHYVEFFTKFYEGGGEPYQPFGVQRRFTMKEVRNA